MSTIAQAVDGLLAGLLLPAARLLWIHGLFKMVVEGLAPVLSFAGRLRGNGSRNRIRCARPKQAGIVRISKSGDKGKYWKGGALCGDRACDEIADNCRDNGAVCRGRVRCRKREKDAAGKM